MKIVTRDQVIGMALGGMAPKAIQERTGLSINTIYADIRSARDRGLAMPKFKTGLPRDTWRVLRVEPSVVDAFTAHALARGIATKTLVERLLAAVARDGLVDAILDDRGGRHD